MPRSLLVILGVPVVLYLVPLVLGVIALRFAAVPVPRFAQVDSAWLDERWITFIRRTLDALTESGFVLRTYIDGMAPKTSRTGVRCAAFLVNEGTGDIAQVAVMDRPTRNRGVELASITILSCSLGSKRIATSNGDTPAVFKYPPTHVGNALPMLPDAAMLYRAHSALRAKHAPNARRLEPPAAGREVNWLTREAADNLGYQVKRGLLKATANGGYQRTWLGAIYSVWKLHPQLVGWHKRRLYAKGVRVLAELGIAPDDGSNNERVVQPNAA